MLILCYSVNQALNENQLLFHPWGSVFNPSSLHETLSLILHASDCYSSNICQFLCYVEKTKYVSPSP